MLVNGPADLTANPTVPVGCLGDRYRGARIAVVAFGGTFMLPK